MTRPPSSSARSGRLSLAVGLGLMLAGLWALVVEYRAGHSGTPLLEVPMAVADFAGTFETATVEAPADLVFKTRVTAPVDNSWMSVHVSAWDSDGRMVSQCDLKLESYHGIHEGRAYQAGIPFASGFLRVPAPGSYRFRIDIAAGQGDSAVPQTMLAGKPLRLLILPGGGSVPRWRLAGFMASTSAGLAVFLSAMAARFRRKENLLETEKNGNRNSLDVSRPKGEGRMLFIDGLRGVACLSVVVCHFLVPGISQIAPALREVLPLFVVEVLRHGELGVEMFFVLSGVVIAYSARNSSISGSFLWRFAARRAVRLDPPYYLALCIAVSHAAWVLPDTLYQLGPWLGGGPGVLANVFYLQNLLRYPAILGIGWTLCLELQFYLAFVILLWMAQSLQHRLRRNQNGNSFRSSRFAFTLVFGPLAVLSLFAWFSSLHDFSFVGTWFRFFLGALTCWAMIGRVGKWIPGSFIPVLLLLALFKNDPRSAVAALTALMILVSHWRGTMGRWLAGPVWQFLGRISYSLYLVYYVVALPLIIWLWTLTPHPPAVAVAFLGAGIALSIAAAWLFYRFIERPSIALSRSISY